MPHQSVIVSKFSILSFFLLCSSISTWAQLSNPNLDFPMALGKINDVITFGDTSYVFGEMDSIAFREDNLVFLDSNFAKTFSLDITHNKRRAIVNRVIGDQAGGYFIFGTFTKVNGVERHNLAHVFSDGTVDTSFIDLRDYNEIPKGQFNAELPKVHYENGQIHLTGTFGNGQKKYESLVFVDSTVTDIGFPSSSGNIYSAAKDGNGGWYVGGRFTDINGTRAINIAHVDANGKVDPSFWMDVSAQVDHLERHGNLLYVSGNLENSGNDTRQIRVVDLTDNKVLNTWSLNGKINKMKVVDSFLIVAGEFSLIGSVQRNGFCMLKTNNYAVAPFDLQLRQHGSGEISVVDFDIRNDTLAMAGRFAINSSSNSKCLVLYDLKSNQLTSFDPGLVDVQEALSVQFNRGRLIYIATAKARKGKTYVTARQFMANVSLANGYGFGTGWFGVNGFRTSKSRHFLLYMTNGQQRLSVRNLSRLELERYAEPYYRLDTAKILTFGDTTVIVGGDLINVQLSTSHNVTAVSLNRDSVLKIWRTDEIHDLKYNPDFFHIDRDLYVSNFCRYPGTFCDDRKADIVKVDSQTWKLDHNDSLAQFLESQDYNGFHVKEDSIIASLNSFYNINTKQVHHFKDTLLFDPNCDRCFKKASCFLKDSIIIFSFKSSIDAYTENKNGLKTYYDIECLARKFPSGEILWSMDSLIAKAPSDKERFLINGDKLLSEHGLYFFESNELARFSIYDLSWSDTLMPSFPDKQQIRLAGIAPNAVVLFNFGQSDSYKKIGGTFAYNNATGELVTENLPSGNGPYRAIKMDSVIVISEQLKVSTYNPRSNTFGNWKATVCCQPLVATKNNQLYFAKAYTIGMDTRPGLGGITYPSKTGNQWIPNIQPTANVYFKKIFRVGDDIAVLGDFDRIDGVSTRGLIIVNDSTGKLVRTLHSRQALADNDIFRFGKDTLIHINKNTSYPEIKTYNHASGKIVDWLSTEKREERINYFADIEGEGLLNSYTTGLSKIYPTSRAWHKLPIRLHKGQVARAHINGTILSMGRAGKSIYVNGYFNQVNQHFLQNTAFFSIGEVKIKRLLLNKKVCAGLQDVIAQIEYHGVAESIIVAAKINNQPVIYKRVKLQTKGQDDFQQIKLFDYNFNSNTSYEIKVWIPEIGANSVFTFDTATINAQFSTSQRVNRSKIQGPSQACVAMKTHYSVSPFETNHVYDWTLANGKLDSTFDSSAVVYWNKAGIGKIILNDSDRTQGCAVKQLMDVQVMNVVKPKIDFHDSIGCTNRNIALKSERVSSQYFKWNFMGTSNDQLIIRGHGVNFIPRTPGVKKFWIEDQHPVAACPVVSDTLKVIIKNPRTIKILGDDTVCVMDSVIFYPNLGGIKNITWLYSGLISDASNKGDSLMGIINKSGILRFKSYNPSNRCIEEDSLYILAQNNPVQLPYKDQSCLNDRYRVLHPLRGSESLSWTYVKNGKLQSQNRDTSFFDWIKAEDAQLAYKKIDSLSGCVLLDTLQITLFPPYLDSIKGPRVACINEPIEFTQWRSTSHSITWFSKNATIESRYRRKTNITWNKSGIQNLTMRTVQKHNDISCSYWDTQQVVVFKEPILSTQAIPEYGSKVKFHLKYPDSIIRYEWKFSPSFTNSKIGDSVDVEFPKKGKYEIRLTAQSPGCKKDTVINFDFIPNNVSIISSDYLDVFPTPVRDWLTLENQFEIPLTVKIHNSLGQPIASLLVNGNMQIETSDWKLGTYYYQFFDQNRLIGTGKLVKI